MKSWVGRLLAVGIGASLTAPACGFNFADRWVATALANPVGPVGTPITLTWSIVPDGTVIPNVFPGVNKASNLITAFDSLLGNGGGGALTQRPWFQRIQQSFDRWSALSGVTFIYSSNDDGAEHGTYPGLRTNGVDVRGDIRLAGTYIDGNSGTLGYTIFPDNADVVLDTGDVTYFGSSANNNVNLRNTTAHELGHSLGLGHTDSNSAIFLMEPFSTAGIDGPQLDDVRGVQQLYGDVFEKANGGAGNNTPETATNLGVLMAGQSKVIGTHAATGTAVLAIETDFVSIANHVDSDCFSFTINTPMSLNATLTPVGASYNERFNSSSPYTTVVASESSDLSLEIYRIDGGAATLLTTANTHPAGQAELVQDLLLQNAGEYVARILGASDIVQFYELNLAVLAVALPSLSDYNQDGIVDAADYVVWRSMLGTTGSGLAADGNGDQTIDAADYEIWRQNFGSYSTIGQGVVTIPEPGYCPLLGMVFLCYGFLNTHALAVGHHKGN